MYILKESEFVNLLISALSSPNPTSRVSLSFSFPKYLENELRISVFMDLFDVS